MVCAPNRQPFPQSSALPPMIPAVWSLHRVPAWQQLVSTEPVIPPSWQGGVFIQVLAVLASADEQSAQGLRKGAWLCAGNSCPSDVKAAPDKAHLSIRVPMPLSSC